MPKTFPGEMVSVPKTSGRVGFRSLWVEQGTFHKNASLTRQEKSRQTIDNSPKFVHMTVPDDGATASPILLQDTISSLYR
jgi:hypothetical protein